MSTTPYLGLTLTGADDTGTAFKDWRQAINGTTDSNMTRLDAGIGALNDALAAKADAEGDWTLIESVTTTETVTEVACSKSFSAKGIMVCVTLPASYAMTLRLIEGTGMCKISIACGHASNITSVRFVIEERHGIMTVMATSAAYNDNGSMSGIATPGNALAAYTMTSMKLQRTSGSGIPSGTTIRFYCRT